MIVKNEEALLAECLDSLKAAMDEINIVDTGSTDRTKEIAASYTDRIFDFQWTGSFSDARNYSFSKATGDYIYCADADELLDESNQKKLLKLKEQLETAPEIEIVQMYYVNQLKNGSVYNFDREYRPKLFKRLRTFRWADPIHEQVVTKPLVFDSDIEIIHRQQGSHADRDLLAFERVLDRGEVLSERLQRMYAMELYKAGNAQHLQKAAPYFMQQMEIAEAESDEFQMSGLIPALAALAVQDTNGFFKYACRLITVEPCSEICLQLARYFEQTGDKEEANLWYYNAAFETKPVLDYASGNQEPLEALAQLAYERGCEEEAIQYRAQAKERAWALNNDRKEEENELGK